MLLKICKRCNLEKDNFSLSFSKDKSKCWERSICKDCQKIARKNYSQKNRKRINAKMSEYRKNNPNKIAKIKNKYYINNKENVLSQVKNYVNNNYDKVSLYNKKYRAKNFDKISNQMAQYFINNKKKILLKQKENYKNNPSLRIRKALSSKIRASLFAIDLRKKSSFLKYLSYSILELKKYLEKQFEPWMNWNNYGIYKIKTWDDNDSSTWTWQIDHIIPHSKFNYSSMEDEDFKNCWSLKNLRPYSSKQNVIDGDR